MQNCVDCGADTIELKIEEDTGADSLTIWIKDNGPGMDRDTAQRAADPFFTTKSKKVGLGLPLFRQAAMISGGSFKIDSKPGKGTVIKAGFGYENIDRQPIGDVAETLITMLGSFPHVKIKYTHIKNGKKLRFDSDRLKSRLAKKKKGAGEYEVLLMVKEYLERRLAEVTGSG